MTDATRYDIGGAAAAYARGRPAYPRAAIDWSVDRAAVAAGADVVDLGAGIGALTVELAARGYHVHAVDPSPAMLARIPRSASVIAHAAPAENTGLPGRSADAIFSGTAWHWFDGAAALAEAERILRPGGALLLLWNLYDESVAWVEEFAAITYRRRDPDSPDARGGRWKSAFECAAGWQPLESAVFPNPHRLTPDGLLNRLGSSSVIAGASPRDRTLAIAEAEDVVRRHGIRGRACVTLPYRTHVYTTRLLTDAGSIGTA